jgi:hypothetical protein
VRLGLAQQLGLALGGTALRLEELSADSLTRVVKAVDGLVPQGVPAPVPDDGLTTRQRRNRRCSSSTPAR